MKKFIAWTLLAAMMLSMLMVAVALADVGYSGPLPLYTNREKVKVYREQSKKAKVIKKIKGATAVTPELRSDDGAWIGILVEDTKHGGQIIGWVLAEQLCDYFPQSLCNHNWSEWTVERQSTCTEKGYRWRTCLICGIRDEKETKKKDHEWGKWKIKKEATCSKKGERVRTCKVCGYEEKEEYLEDHSFGEWTILKDPTCSEKGLRTHTCRVCGTEKQQELDTLPHDFEYRVTVEATDHSAGIRAQVCRVCGYATAEESYDPEGTIRRGARGDEVRDIQQLLVEQGYLNAGGADGIFGGGTEKALVKYQTDRGLNPDGIAWPQTIQDLQHDYGPWVIVKPMTRTEAGERMRTCRGCGFEQHEIIESGTAFERGRRGEDVRALQQIIKETGYDAGGFDGIYGKKLDAALAGFAADHGMMVENGKIRPSDIDAVVNAWIAGMPDDAWMGEGGADTTVNLALTVTQTGEPDETGIATYNWSVTNLGTNPAMFTALLLTFGEPIFREDNLVMVLDGVELKPNATNSASGTFTADAEWGEGNMNFAAIAVSEATGSKWMSNIVEFGNASASAAKTVAPQSAAIDVMALADGIYPVSFDRGDVLGGASGVFMNAVHVFSEDVYDIVEVDTLAVGDTLVVGGESYAVTGVENQDGTVLVNGGLDAGGFTLVPEDESNCFKVRGYNDLTTYTERGVTTLTVDPSATFTDGWNIDAEPVVTNYDGIVAAMQASENDMFTQDNTTVRVEGGKVVEINRVYVP